MSKPSKKNTKTSTIRKNSYTDLNAKSSPPKNYFRLLFDWIKSHYIRSAGLIVVFSFLIHTGENIYPFIMDHAEGKWGGEIVLGLQNEAFSKNSPTYIFFSIPSNANEARLLIPINLSVRNDSKKADSNVSLSIAYNKANNRAAISEEFIKHAADRPASDVSHELHSSDLYDYSDYRVKFLSAGDSVAFSEGAFTSSVPLDNKMLPLFTTGTGVNIKVSTYSQNDIKREWNIHYKGIRIDSDKGVEAWLRNWYGKQIAIEIREDSGFWNYLYGLLSSKDIVIYWFLPDYNFLQQQNLYIPKNSPREYKGFKFDPYVWSLLFDFDLK